MMDLERGNQKEIRNPQPKQPLQPDIGAPIAMR